MTELIDVLTDAIVEQLNELINSSPKLNHKTTF